MATKKTTNKKEVAKKAPAKTTAKKPAPKKATAKKPTAGRQSAQKSLAILPAIKTSTAKGNTRRPTPNPPLTDETMTIIANAFSAIRDILTESAANIRALDRSRLNGVGIKKQGFIERTYAAAVENPQFLPTYLNIDKFRDDFQYFVNLRTLFEGSSQLREFIWNLTIQGADISYTDALEYYAAVREAAQRRIDGAETIFKDLSPFFKKMGTRSENSQGAETKKKTEREVKALLNGKRDGKIVIENIMPKLTAGKRNVIEEKYTDTAQFKETKEGEIKE